MKKMILKEFISDLTEKRWSSDYRFVNRNEVDSFVYVRTMMFHIALKEEIKEITQPIK